MARKTTRMHVTIHDVARRANVTVGTVSKALNRNGSLRQETRDRIIAVAKQLGFRPNDLAQSLHRGQSLTVGLISTDSFGRFTIPIMEGLEECLADLEWLPAKGYVLVFTDSELILPDDEEEFATFLEVLNDAGETWAGGKASARARSFHSALTVSDRNKSKRQHWGLPQVAASPVRPSRRKG